MPDNGSGSFSPPSASFPFVPDTLADADKVTDVINDIAAALSNRIAKDGQTTVTANIPLNGFKLTGVGAATSRTDAASLTTIQDGTGIYIASVGGTSDVITLTASPAISTYAAGQSFKFLASGSNLGAVTVSISGLPAKDLTKNNGITLVANDLIAGAMISMTYDGTRFLLDVQSASLADNSFRIVGSGDATRRLAFEVGGITTATTRTLIVPDADLTLPAVTATGDLVLASGPGVLTKLPIGTAGTIPMSIAAAANKVAYVAALTKAIYGLTYANNGTDNLDIAAGGAMDDTGAYWLTAAALTKQTNVAWAVGTSAGMLDTGAVGNSDYYVWLIGRSDTNVIDYLSSLSSTSPTLPANYDFKRLIGWFKRVAGVVVAFHTYELDGGGLEMNWDVPTLDINLTTTLSTIRRTDAVKVPLTFSVIAQLNVVVTEATNVGSVHICCPDQTDAAPSLTAAPLANLIAYATGSVTSSATTLRIRTSAAGLIAARSTAASTIDLYAVSTMGFSWARRN